jgi:hypothetical protein
MAPPSLSGAIGVVEVHLAAAIARRRYGPPTGRVLVLPQRIVVPLQTTVWLRADACTWESRVHSAAERSLLADE